jgi:hypothetical protein
MRGLLAAAVAVLVAGVVALALRGGAAPPLPAVPEPHPAPGPSASGPGALPAAAVEVQPVPPTPQGTPRDPRGVQVEAAVEASPPRGTTYEHYVNGAVVPADIRRSVGLTDADAALLQRATAAENEAIAAALRDFIATLPGFVHSADEVAHASALELMEWVAQHQPMHLAKASVEQLMDDTQFQRYQLGRAPWDEFFPRDGLVMRYVHVMHGVRRATLQRLTDGGMDRATLDRLRSRWLLDGHFRLAADRPFEFGNPPAE